MVRNDILYKFCKKYTEQYEQCEEEARDVIEDKLHDSGMLGEIFSKCAMSKAGLQALIVDDFVKQLDEELQMKIIMHCIDVNEVSD